MTKPLDTQYNYMDMDFKKGVHGLMFVWRSERWIRTSMSFGEIVAGSNKELRQIRNRLNKSVFFKRSKKIAQPQ
jgi:hypothetical protein